MRKQIVFVSGKGGTGKTSLCAAFVSYLGNSTIVDCDVDAPDLHLLLNPEIYEKEDYVGGRRTYVVAKKCRGCARCIKVCEFNAIVMKNTKAIIYEELCESCNACKLVCPAGAITTKKEKSGEILKGKIRYGEFIYAHLFPGEENTGKLISILREEALAIAEQNASDLMIIDGPPGTGCSFVSSVTGVDLCVFVVEPTLSGFADFKRALKVSEHFKIKAVVILNKSDLNLEIGRDIKRFLKRNNIPLIGEIPFNDVFYESIQKNKTVYELAESHLKDKLKITFEKILKSV